MPALVSVFFFPPLVGGIKGRGIEILNFVRCGESPVGGL